jgi:hypothetical protein
VGCQGTQYPGISPTFPGFGGLPANAVPGAHSSVRCCLEEQHVPSWIVSILVTKQTRCHCPGPLFKPPGGPAPGTLPCLNSEGPGSAEQEGGGSIGVWQKSTIPLLRCPAPGCHHRPVLT